MKMKNPAILAGIALFALAPATSVLSAENSPSLIIYKSEYCGCCEEWMHAMEQAGFPVEVHNLDDLTRVKAEADVPASLESCHTAYLDLGRQYVLEGHVPIEAIGKLIAENPDIHGISVPGMPSGSLGMGGPLEPHAVHSFMADGTVHPMPFHMVTE